jgi:PAS domain-containing protein
VNGRGRFRPNGPRRGTEDETPIGRALRGEASDESELEVHPPGAPGPLVLATTTRPLVDEDGRCRGAVAILRDVSAQKESARIIREEEKRFRAFIDQIPVAVWIKGSDGRLQYVNPCCATYFRRPVEQVVGRTTRELFPPELAEAHLAGDRLAIINGVPTAEIIASQCFAAGIRSYSSAVFSFLPEFALGYYRAVRDADQAEVDRLLNAFYVPLTAIRARRRGYAVSIMKAGLSLVGKSVGPVRPPLVELTAGDLDELGALIGWAQDDVARRVPEKSKAVV